MRFPYQSRKFPFQGANLLKKHEGDKNWLKKGTKPLNKKWAEFFGKHRQEAREIYETISYHDGSKIITYLYFFIKDFTIKMLVHQEFINQF